MSEEEQSGTPEEQHVSMLLQEEYNWKTGDSILMDLKERGILSDSSFGIIKAYIPLGIWETKFIDLINLGDSLLKVMDTIPSMQKTSPFAFDVKENATWRDFKQAFSRKGYSLSPVMDTYSRQFIRNPKFEGSGCPLMYNPDYHKIIPNSIIKTNPEQYKKRDPETGFIYLYTNEFSQNMYGAVGNGSVRLEFFGDSLVELGYYLNTTPNLHDLFLEKYGYPVYDRTERSDLNGSDSINVMIWEYKNMRIRYKAFLRYKFHRKETDLTHSIGVYSEHKRRCKERDEYKHILKQRQHEDYIKWRNAEDEKQKKRDEELKRKQMNAFKNAI